MAPTPPNQYAALHPALRARITNCFFFGSKAYAPALVQTAESNVPACVSALLDQTRRLETALQRWAALEITENEVSDVFVTVGNTFHAMLAAFAAWNIDMRYVYFFYVRLCVHNLNICFIFLCVSFTALSSRISLA